MRYSRQQKEESRKNPFQFAGQLEIQSSGKDFLYMRNRFYTMETGRFIAEESIGFADGDISSHRYLGMIQ